METEFYKGDKVKTLTGTKVYTVQCTFASKVFVNGRLTPFYFRELIKIPKHNEAVVKYLKANTTSKWVEDCNGKVVEWFVGDIVRYHDGYLTKVIEGFSNESNKMFTNKYNSNELMLSSTRFFYKQETKGENMSLAEEYKSGLTLTKPKQNPSDNSLEGRYAQIVGTVQSMSHEINATTEIQSSSQLSELFAKAKSYVDAYEVTKKKDTSGFFSKLFGFDKKKEEELNSINKSTDAIFSVIHNEYNKLVETGTKFQRLKSDMIKQLKDLEELKIESNAEMQVYLDTGDMIPMRLISTNTQIEASCEAYKEKLLKIEVGITLTTGAVIALGAKLPAMRAGLADETAYAALIGSVSNVHEVVKGTSDLILGIADLTSAEAHKKVDEMMQAQINDTSTIDYLQSRRVHSDALATMIYTNADLLADKLMMESSTVKQLVLESKSSGSTSKLEQLNYIKPETLSLPTAPSNE